MKKLILCAMVLLLALLAIPALSWMMIEPIEKRYTPYSKSSAIDQALADLGNLPGRVYGDRQSFSEIGTTESLYFAGDTKVFNAFIAQFAKLKYAELTVYLVSLNPDHPPVLRIQKPGSDCDGKPVEMQEIHYDWMLGHFLPGSKGGTAELVYIKVWPGKIQWNEVQVPSNVTVKNEVDRSKPEPKPEKDAGPVYDL